MRKVLFLMVLGAPALICHPAKAGFNGEVMLADFDSRFSLMPTDSVVQQPATSTELKQSDEVILRPLPKGKAYFDEPEPVIVREEEQNTAAKAHLASYNTKEMAEKGDKVVRNKYAEAKDFKTEIAYEQTSKGYFYRLYFIGKKPALTKFCNVLTAKKEYCKIT